MKKHIQKGFTLIEMVIVLALFSIVMYGVFRFLLPVSRFFVRSSNFETTTACIDNMKRAIEGNLKYADRVRVYSKYDPSTAADNVEDFWEEFFKDREMIDCKGSIYVMVFDSTSTGTSWNLPNVASFNQGAHNSGKITLQRYEFDNTQVHIVESIPWYVNQKMYANYNYSFQLGTSSNGFTVADDAAFDPSDCTITITSYEVADDPENTGWLYQKDTPNISVASFSMKNVLDATQKYTTPTFDYKIVKHGATNDVTPSGVTVLNPNDHYRLPDDDADTPMQTKYIVETDSSTGMPIAHSRYTALIENPVNEFTGFYFIFTLPESVEDDTTNPEYRTYLDEVNAAYGVTP